uniref:Uncharacterized protein n=1 Tax=Anopheles darlingi TaxID=43151 RepID=A0A2M4DFJ5_ANODA
MALSLRFEMLLRWLYPETLMLLALPLVACSAIPVVVATGPCAGRHRMALLTFSVEANVFLRWCCCWPLAVDEAAVLLDSTLLDFITLDEELFVEVDD